MVNLEARQYQDKQQQWHTSYKVGMMNPATGCGMINRDVIFGQFARQPFINLRNGPKGQFKQINASVFWLNGLQDGSIQLNQYGNVEMTLPEKLSSLIEAQDWTGRFFIITLEPITLQGGRQGCKFKLLETDQNGQPLPIQPIPQMPVIPQNRTTTPQYYPGHAPVQTNVPVHIQSPSNLPMGQNRMTGQNMVQARQMFGTNPGNIHPDAVRQLQQQGQWPQNVPQVNQNQSYQVPPQNVYPNIPRPAMPNMNAQAPMSAARQQAMQQNPMNPPQVNYGPVPIQPVATMPPLPNMNNQVPQVQQSAMPQAPMTLAQGNQIPVPQLMNQQVTTPNASFTKFGLNSDEIEVLESLLNDAQLKDWKQSANRDVQFFGEAIQVTANFRQKQIADNRLPVLWECWQTL
jgi:hypothetical protein